MIMKCKRCGKVRLIMAKELCLSCYNYMRQKDNPKYKKQRKEYYDKWRKSERGKKYFRDYMREYYRKPENKKKHNEMTKRYRLRKLEEEKNKKL